VTTGIAKTGVVGLLERQTGPVVLVRFDMDALPSPRKRRSYASTVPGKCTPAARSGHVSIGLTVARMLHAQRAELAGTVKFVFQPAEEDLRRGDRRGRDDDARGRARNPKPDRRWPCTCGTKSRSAGCTWRRDPS
jgi:amidohydrolase